MRWPHDRHHPVRVIRGPELAEPVRLGLVAGVGEVRHAADRPVLGDRLGVVGEGAVGGGRSRHHHLLGAGVGGGLERGLGAVDVDVVHHRLVPDRVEDEGEVDQRVDLVPLEQLPDRVAVADVALDELGLRPRRGGGFMSTSTIFSVSSRAESSSVRRPPM